MSCGDDDHNLAARAKKCAGARTQHNTTKVIYLNFSFALPLLLSILLFCFERSLLFFFIWWERAERIWVFVAFLLCQRPLDQWAATTFVDREQHTRRRGECKKKKRSKINASGTQTNWWNELFAKDTIETRKEHKKTEEEEEVAFVYFRIDRFCLKKVIGKCRRVCLCAWTVNRLVRRQLPNMISSTQTNTDWLDKQ